MVVGGGGGLGGGTCFSFILRRDFFLLGFQDFRSSKSKRAAGQQSATHTHPASAEAGREVDCDKGVDVESGGGCLGW